MTYNVIRKKIQSPFFFLTQSENIYSHSTNLNHAPGKDPVCTIATILHNLF